jgi:membrane-bound lytic murein transglycosylase D
MPSLPLLLILSLSPRLWASQTTESDAPPAADDGTLWDYVEDGTDTSEIARPARILPLRNRRGRSQAADVTEADQAAPDTLVDDDEWTAGAPPDLDTDDVAAFVTNPAATLRHNPAAPEPIPGDPYYLTLFDPSEYDIPVEINDAVVGWIKYFTGTGRKHYHRYLERSTAVRPLMYEKLDAAGAPRDLVYLSMIESGYNTHATSHAAAVGLWQFIAPTARMYDLRVDSWIDERRDPELAAEAAIRFLTDMHKDFGHWYLAWAGYNGGPGRVDRNIARYGTHDFWTMVSKGGFHSETQQYVPKIIAAAIIGKHPERYGFTDLKYLEPVLTDKLDVSTAVSIDTMAKCAGISADEFRKLNPHLRQNSLPDDGKTHRIYVPKSGGDSFLAALELVPPEERIVLKTHKVQRGESLGTIASRYGTTVGAIQEANRIRNPNVISVGSSLVIPGKGMSVVDSGETALASSAGGGSTRSPAATSSSSSSKKSSKKSSSSTKATSYTVRKGDTLGSIASSNGISLDELRSNNGIKGSHIEVGQKLSLTGKAASSASSSSSSSTYTVRKGDTLSSIAAAAGCSISDIKRWNNIKGDHIEAGQKLKTKG